MQPEAQTTTRGYLAVSAGALEIANVIQGTLKVFWFTFTFTLNATSSGLYPTTEILDLQSLIYYFIVFQVSFGTVVSPTL